MNDVREGVKRVEITRMNDVRGVKREEIRRMNDVR